MSIYSLMSAFLMLVTIIDSCSMSAFIMKSPWCMSGCASTALFALRLDICLIIEHWIMHVMFYHVISIYSWYTTVSAHWSSKGKNQMVLVAKPNTNHYHNYMIVHVNLLGILLSKVCLNSDINIKYNRFHMYEDINEIWPAVILSSLIVCWSHMQSVKNYLSI